MPSAEHQVTIGRPIADVFAYVADGLNGPRWRPGIVDIELTSGEGATAVYRQGVRGPGGRRIDADYEITTYQPDTHLAFRAIAGPVRPVGEYRLESVPTGTTLTFSLAAELTGFKRLLMSAAVQRTMDAEVRATERLKQLLEGTAG